MEKSFLKMQFIEPSAEEQQQVYPLKYPARYGAVVSGTLYFGSDPVVFGTDEVEF